jgi:hypothetical protein
MACLFNPEVRKVGQRLGTLNTAWIGRVPNLPNVPNLFPPVYTHTRAHTRAHMTQYTLGRLGRLGSSSIGAGSSLPNLLPTFLTYGDRA